MKKSIFTITTLNILLASVMPVMADEVNSNSNIGERINARLDQRG